MGDNVTVKDATESRGTVAVPCKCSSTVPGVAHSDNCNLVRSPASQERKKELQEDDDDASEKIRASSR